MKVRMKKLWFTIPLLLMLGAIVYYGYMQRHPASTEMLSFRIGTGNSAETISAWYDGEGTYYVFLPSYADIRRVTASVDPACTVRVNDTVLTEETDLSVLNMGELYDIRITCGGETQKNHICFLQSANTAAMYIDIMTGNFYKMCEDKDRKEPSSVRLYASGGNMEYKSGMEPDYLKGRGNSTWMKAKKPFNLYLARPAGLLGMGEAENWVLLANAYDETNLRNKLIQDFAGSIAPYDGFACQSRYVDLYINKKYYGLFLLSENVESVFRRLKPGEEDVLFALHQLQKIDHPESSIVWNDEMAVEIHHPEAPGKDRIGRLRETLMNFQTAAARSDGQKGDTLSSYIDYDSWIRKFLIDQIFLNFDAMIDSSYFWVSSEDSKIYAGPCWDYDLTVGISFYPGRNSPNTPPGSDRWGDENTWYASLWENKRFRDASFRTYLSIFVPRLEELLSSTKECTAESIRRSSEMNSIRWKKMFEGSKTWSDNESDFSECIQDRMAFLESLWLRNTDYHTITLKLPDGIKSSFYTVSGEVCEEIPAPEEVGFEGASVWYREDTDAPFDFNTVITEDLTLFVKQEEKSADTGSAVYSNYYEMLAVELACTLLVLVLPALMWADYRRNSRKR